MAHRANWSLNSTAYWGKNPDLVRMEWFKLDQGIGDINFLFESDGPSGPRHRRQNADNYWTLDDNKDNLRLTIVINQNSLLSPTRSTLQFEFEQAGTFYRK